MGIHNEYFVKYGLNLYEKKQIALAILQEVSLKYESMQALQPGGTSSFEPSDLVSNLLSFYFFVEGYKKDEIFKLCAKRSKEESLAIYKQYPQTFSSAEYKNKTFLPIFLKNKYCTIAKFPEKFQKLTPAIKKDKSFRDWDDLLDVYKGIDKSKN
jgi:hypothetical protein